MKDLTSARFAKRDSRLTSTFALICEHIREKSLISAPTLSASRDSLKVLTLPLMKRLIKWDKTILTGTVSTVACLTRTRMKLKCMNKWFMEKVMKVKSMRMARCLFQKQISTWSRTEKYSWIISNCLLALVSSITPICPVWIPLRMSSQLNMFPRTPNERGKTPWT